MGTIRRRNRANLIALILLVGAAFCMEREAVAGVKDAPLVNHNGWFAHGDTIIWGWVQHNGWWRPGQRPNLTRRSVGDLLGDLRPNRTEDLDALTDNMLRYGYPGFEHNYGLWFDRRRDAHDTAARTTPHAQPPFLEQPWARSERGRAWDGMSKYDLKKFNPWYFDRLRAFANLCDEKGTVLFHKFYMQHALLENQAHYVDFPWRPGNSVQDTGMPDHIPAANAFYDVTHPGRRELHRLYIRRCLEALGDNSHVVHLIGEEFTGPLPFVEFWIDTLVDWENETGKEVHIGLGVPRDVQDAILADPVREAAVDVLDLRYWWTKTNGELYAPKGGQELPGRGLERGSRQAEESSPERIYEKVQSMRRLFPNKGIIDAIEADRRQSWAFLMAGGGLLVRGGISYPDNSDPVEYIKPADVDIILPTYDFIRNRLARTAPMMRSVDIVRSSSSPTWCLAAKHETFLAYTLGGGSFALDLTGAKGDYSAAWFNPRSGAIQEAQSPLVVMDDPAVFETPSQEDWALWLKRKPKPNAGN